MKNIPFYYLNLDDNLDRNTYIINEFDRHNICTYTRVSAIDGRNNKLQYIVDKYGLGVGSADLAVALSHLKSINLFSSTVYDYAIICEDDVDLSIINYWNFTWDDFFSMLPFGWDIIQLTTSSQNIIFNLHKRKINDWGTVAYLINQKYAKELLSFLNYSDDTMMNFNNLKNWKKPSKNSQAIAEGTIYRSNNSYSIPLLSYSTNFNSNVHINHVNDIHIPAKNKIKNFWINNKLKISQLINGT